MPKFIIIEVDENDTLEDQAECIRRVEGVYADGFTSGLDKWNKFEVIHTINHQTINDAVKAIGANDE